MDTGSKFLIRPILVGSIAAALIFSLVWKIQAADYARHLQEEGTQVLQTVSLIRAKLEGTINSHIFLARGLVGLVVDRPDIDPVTFDAVARELIRGHEGIRSVQLAKDSVVTHVYPLADNEKAVGLRLLDLPSQREAVERAITTGRTVVAGPVELVQGGVAFVSRTPIFLPVEEGAEELRYWGLASLLLDRDYVYRKAELEEWAEGLRLAIRGRDSLGRLGEVFYGDPQVFEQGGLLTEVTLPNGTWQLAALPSVGWGVAAARSANFKRFAGVVFAATGGMLIGLLVYRPQRMLQTNQALAAARRQAECAAAERSRFLAAASHDLRQPLHALGIFIGELRERNEQPALNGLVEKIQFSSDALGDLLDNLLDISRLDAGAVRPQPASIALGPMIERLVVENAPAALAKGLRLRFVPTRAVATSDPALLECLVRNLVVNAIKYTQRGGVLVGCRRRGNALRIEIWDTGPGIPVHEQQNIFEEFYQLHNPERDRRKGLGLGLAIVKRLSTLLDHPIEIRSVVGQGTVFSVSVIRGERPQVDRVPSRFSPAGLSLRGVTVLLVDDDPLVLEAMQSLLSQWGCTVLAATHGEEAERLVKESGGSPALVLCDYRLGNGETGDGVIRRLHALNVDPAVIYLLSGDTTDQVQEVAEMVGCRVLAKPLSPARLRALLRVVAQRHPRPKVAVI